MQFTGNAATDVATIVAFDPAAVSTLLCTPKQKSDDWNAAVAEGRMAMYLPGGDGCSYFTAYVNEEPPERISAAILSSADGYLHLKTGILCITGAEDLQQEDPKDPPDRFDPAMGERFSVQPGWYRIHMAEINWDDGGAMVPDLAAQLPKSQQEAMRTNENSCLVGVAALLLGGIAIVCGIVLDLLVAGFRFWWVLVGVFTLWLGMYLYLVFNPRTRAMTVAAEAYQKLHEQYRKEHPTLVFVLGAVSQHEIPQDLTGCRLEN